MLGNPQQLTEWIVQKLDGVAADLYKDLVSTAKDKLTTVVFSAAVSALATKFNPAVGLIKSLFDGLDFFSKNVKAIEQFVTDFFGGINTVINGPVTSVGDWVKGLLNHSVPIILQFATTQLGLQNVPQTIQDIVKSLDLRTWIVKGVEKLWEKVKQRPPFQAIEAKILGQQLSAKIGDPIWVAKARDGGLIIGNVMYNGVPITTQFAKWQVLANAAGAGAVNYLNTLRSKVDDFQKSEWLPKLQVN